MQIAELYSAGSDLLTDFFGKLCTISATGFLRSTALDGPGTFFLHHSQHKSIKMI